MSLSTPQIAAQLERVLASDPAAVAVAIRANAKQPWPDSLKQQGRDFQLRWCDSSLAIREALCDVEQHDPIPQTFRGRQQPASRAPCRGLPMRCPHRHRCSACASRCRRGGRAPPGARPDRGRRTSPDRAACSSLQLRLPPCFFDCHGKTAKDKRLGRKHWWAPCLSPNPLCIAFSTSYPPVRNVPQCWQAGSAPGPALP